MAQVSTNLNFLRNTEKVFKYVFGGEDSCGQFFKNHC